MFAGRSLLIVVGVAIVCAAIPAAAETPQEKAAAKALFDDGRRLLKEGKIAEACPKFEESFRISPLIGSKLNYAACLKQLGKTASAWAEFREVATLAAKAGDDREAFARERIAELDKQLARLTVRLTPGADLKGLEIKHDGATLSRAILNTAVPVDPGSHVIEATAPGKTSWASKVEIGPAASVTVEVPVLGEPTRYPEMPAQRPPVARTPAAEPVRDEGTPDPGRTRRWLGLGVGGAGLVGIGVGVVFGLGAKSKWDDAKAGHCNDDGQCDQAGVDLVNDARSAGTISTIAVGVGAAAVATGVILYLTAPKAAAPVRVDAALGPGTALVTVSGRL